MMQQLNIYEAKTQLSYLVDAASQGETFIIAKAGKPLAKLVPLSSGKKKKKFKFGALKGKIKLADNFDDPLPEEVIDLFK